jgi:hypothetical protein
MPSISRRDIDEEVVVQRELEEDLNNIDWYGTENEQIIARMKADEEKRREECYQSLWEDIYDEQLHNDWDRVAVVRDHDDEW